MRRAILALLFSVLCVSSNVQSAEPKIRDIYPDTWVGTDALGRTMPTNKQVGPLKQDQRRVVGMYYITWHRDSNKNLKSPYQNDVTKILAKEPNARLDGENPAWGQFYHHWGEPEDGYFLSKDEYVIRKDMSMLADAGVDVIILDVTNAVEYWEEWSVLLPLMQKMKAECNKVPQFCFWAFNGPVMTVCQDLYETIYKPGLYKDLWFMWDGKPLLLYNESGVSDVGQKLISPNKNYDPKAKTDPNNPHYGDPDYTNEVYADYTKDVKNFFTRRTMWWGYHTWAGKRFLGTENNWAYGYELLDAANRSMNPDDLLSRHNGKKEQAAVTSGQHAIWGAGKSWSRSTYEPKLNDQDLPVPTYVPWLGKTVDHPEGYGIYFQDRWDEAIASNPEFLYVNDWNEWTAIKFPTPNEPKGTTIPFLGRQCGYYFVDQYNSEFNRTIQPMKGGYTDNYYMQLAENVRRYKGARPIPVIKGYTPINIDGQFADWQKSTVEYRDTVGDVAHRDYAGYGGNHYINNSGRNDITASKVAVDPSNVCFYAQTAKPLTVSTGSNWMLLLIDIDRNATTGWCGYEYLINKDVLSPTKTTLMKYDQGKWVKVSELNYRYAKNGLEIAIPRNLLGLKGNSFSFDFHWADNPADLTDAISLCINGDSAPNRRFNYRCIWNK